MRKKTRRKVSMLLAVMTVATLLSACDDNNKGGNSNPNGGVNAPEVTGDYVYVAEFFPMPEKMANVWNMKYQNGWFYFLSEEYDESLNPDTNPPLVPLEAGPAPTAAPEPEDSDEKSEPGEVEPDEEWQDKWNAYYTSRRTIFYRINSDGTELVELSDYIAPKAEEREGWSGYANAGEFIVDAEGNIWIQEYYNYYKIIEYGNDYSPQNYEDIVVIRKLDSNGAEIFRLDTTELLKNAENPYINYFCVDGEGRLYMAAGGQEIYVSDETGGLLFRLELEDWVYNMAAFAEGKVGVITYDNEVMGQVIKMIDPDKKSWGKTIALPPNVYDIFQGNAEYDFLCRDSSNLYGFNIEKGEREKILNWIDADINGGNVRYVYTTASGGIMAISYDYNSYGQQIELILLSKRPASEVEEKIILTLAGLWIDSSVLAEVVRFNKTNGKYRIRVEDYSQYITSGDYDSGYNRFLTDLTAGKVPDILMSDNVPMQTYANQGILQDLYPFIDSDPELGRDKLVEGALKSFELNGKLYQTVSSFTLETFAGKKRIVGDKIGWTIDEMNAALAAMPEGAKPFMPYITQSTMLYYSLMFGMSQYVDWSTGRCSFDSDAFIKLLEMAKTFPSEFEYTNWEDMEPEDEMLRYDRVMLTEIYVSSFDEIRWRKASFGEEITYVGFPNEAGNSGAILYSYGGMMMTSKCADKEGAWQFLRTTFTEDYQKNNWRMWGFPTNRAVMDLKIDQTLHPEKYDGSSSGGMVVMSRAMMVDDSYETEPNPVTQADIDMLLEIMSKAAGTYSYDEKIVEIINEEVQPFFAGQKPARDVAKIIQNKVWTYVNEQI